jgi:hypothetical protein
MLTIYLLESDISDKHLGQHFLLDTKDSNDPGEVDKKLVVG